MKCSPAVGRRRRPGVPRVDGLVALRVGERLGDVRRQRRLARRLAVEPHAPAALAEMLEQLDRPVAPAGAQPPGRPRERLPDAVAEPPRAAAPPRFGCSIGMRAGNDPRVVDDDEGVAEFPCKFREFTVPGTAPEARSQTSRRDAVPARRPDAARSARAEGRSRARMTSSGEHAIVAPVDQDALERARERLSGAAAGGPRQARRRRGGARARPRPGRGARGRPPPSSSPPCPTVSARRSVRASATRRVRSRASSPKCAGSPTRRSAGSSGSRRNCSPSATRASTTSACSST